MELDPMCLDPMDSDPMDLDPTVGVEPLGHWMYFVRPAASLQIAISRGVRACKLPSRTGRFIMCIYADPPQSARPLWPEPSRFNSLRFRPSVPFSGSHWFRWGRLFVMLYGSPLPPGQTITILPAASKKQPPRKYGLPYGEGRTYVLYCYALFCFALLCYAMLCVA